MNGFFILGNYNIKTAALQTIHMFYNQLMFFFKFNGMNFLF